MPHGVCTKGCSLHSRWRATPCDVQLSWCCSDNCANRRHVELLNVMRSSSFNKSLKVMVAWLLFSFYISNGCSEVHNFLRSWGIILKIMRFFKGYKIYCSFCGQKPITLLCILFMFIEMKFIHCHSCVMFAIKSMSICND